VRLHVVAKRYLVTTRGAYARKLSEEARRSLAHQGGHLSEEECAAFERHPFFADAIQLRIWEDLGKKEGWFESTPQDALDQLDELIQSLHAISVM
jgi:predicted HD phosphohydrolase